MSLADELHRLIPSPCCDRPFVCDGLPESCDVVVIGENPATKINVNWWRFWDDKNGFNLAKFERAYEKARVADGKPAVSPTRWRLKRLQCNGLKCLETNFFSNEQLGGHGVGISSDDLLTGLIDHRHLPQLRAVIVHGSVAREHWCRLGLKLPTGVQCYFTSRHLSRVGYAEIDEVSRKILGQDAALGESQKSKSAGGEARG
jgi:hypothetical protein